LAFHAAVLADREFQKGAVDTGLVARWLERRGRMTETVGNG